MSKQITLFILLSLFAVSCSEKENKTTEFLKKYDKIRIISYNKHREIYATKYELKIENDTIQIPDIKIVDNIILNQNFSKKITEVLISTENQCVVAHCYNPRHIILFYKKNKVVDFYEFCAECGGSRQSKDINFPELCTDKGDKIIEVFKEMKLKNTGEETENYKYF